MIIYPRSLAGMNLNPINKEKKFQHNKIDLLLARMKYETYLHKSGWDIIRDDRIREHEKLKHTFDFNQVFLNESFQFDRPLTVTGAYLLPNRTVDGKFFPEEIFFHQMVLDSIDNEFDYINAEYVILNTSFAEGGPVLKIPKTRAYYVNESTMQTNQTASGEFKYLSAFFRLAR
jgi:hypothetical protein